MRIYAVDEFNDDGHLIYSVNYIGAFVRGRNRDEALAKFPSEVNQYCRWRGINTDKSDCTVTVVQEKHSDLQICDADSDVIFDSEQLHLTTNEYEELKSLALKSAEDFHALFLSISDINKSLGEPRKTFYGSIPHTAREMYEHTKNVNSYYFGEIGVDAENEPDIYSCRLSAFESLENQSDYLKNPIFDGSYGEMWSLRKVCRRFIWHDRIHAKAMYRRAASVFGKENIANPFFFDI